MAARILYFDIGNTNTKIGVGRGSGPLVTYVLPTDSRQTADEFGLSLLALLRHMDISPDAVSACVGSSVVPGMSRLIRQAVGRFLNLPLLLAPEDLPVPLENRYARPHEVGADRLVGAYGARRLFPDPDCIVSVDFGTATTFDCVKGNAYLGGLICPGVFSSAGALAGNTAKLPQISLEVEGISPVPGQSTATSLNHGFVFGFASMAEGLIARLTRKIAPEGGTVFAVATGGFAAALAQVTDCFHAVRPDLVLDGLRMVYEEHVK